MALVPIATGGRPLFRNDREGYSAFYAPGCLCVVPQVEADRFAAKLARGEGGGWAARLWQRAEQAEAQAAGMREAPFRPECLTLYLHDECPLRCTYCYADPRPPSSGALLDRESVAAAADLVAANCRAKGLPFPVGFHGGGEPTLHPEQVEALLALARRAADRHGVALRPYIATNGALSEEKVAWLARTFAWVGLSCDGPAEIHDAQRPDRRGRGTLHLVERTARVLRQEGARVRVRATITAASLRRQAEVAAYLCQQLSPAEIHFEPVYGGGRSPRGGLATAAETSAQARTWVENFLEARDVAAGYGVALHTSGARLGEVHGPFCQVLRQVLHLVPGEGVATACFKAADAAQARRLATVVGALAPATGRFEIDAGRVAALRRQLAELPTRCADCFNRFHCARDCPDGCPLDGVPEPASTSSPGFRCQAQRLLATAILEQKAAELWADAQRSPEARQAGGIHGTTLL